MSGFGVRQSRWVAPGLDILQTVSGWLLGWTSCWQSRQIVLAAVYCCLFSWGVGVCAVLTGKWVVDLWGGGLHFFGEPACLTVCQFLFVDLNLKMQSYLNSHCIEIDIKITGLWTDPVTGTLIKWTEWCNRTWRDADEVNWVMWQKGHWLGEPSDVMLGTWLMF